MGCLEPAAGAAEQSQSSTAAILQHFKEDLHKATVHTDRDGPIFPGGKTWKEVMEMLSKEAGVSLEGLTVGEARGECLKMLKEIAGKDWKMLASHDLRKNVLLRQDEASDCNIGFLRPFFEHEKPKVAVSYQWAAKLSDVCKGMLDKKMTVVCNGPMCVTV